MADFPHAARAVREQHGVEYHATDSDLSEAERQAFARDGFHSKLLVPLVAHGMVLGLAVVCENQQPRYFSVAETRLAQTMARQSADVVENARLLAALEGEKHRLELLFGLRHQLTASLDVGEVAARALKLVREAFDAETGAMFVAEIGSEQIGRLATCGADGLRDGGAPDSSLADALVDEAVASRQIIFAREAPTAPNGAINSIPLGGGSAVAVPLQIGETLRSLISQPAFLRSRLQMLA